MKEIWKKIKYSDEYEVSNICCCCKGIYKTCGNYIWRYAEIEKIE